MRYFACVLILGVTLSARAEEPVPPGLFPPTLIMSHQQELGLSEAQRTAIVKEVQATQSHVLQLQWQMSEAMEALAKQLEAARVDEAKALASADKVLGCEREVKRSQLQLLIRLKNLLTAEQQARARDLRPRAP